ncbi:MAG: hypothetical protein U0670_16650 [Anaerolineae bacterium]
MAGQQTLSEPFMIAYMGRRVFAILLPETPAADANAIAAQLYELMRTNVFRFNAYVATFDPKIGLIESSGGLLTAQEVMVRASEALKRAGNNVPLRIELMRTTPTAFDTGDFSAIAVSDNGTAASSERNAQSGGS